MANTAANVRVGVSGAVYAAPVGTTLPTNEDATLDAAFIDQGFISDDGITEQQARSLSNIIAWQNASVVRKLQTEHDAMFSFTMIETSDATLETYYGNFEPDGGVVQITPDQLPHRSWVIDIFDGETDGTPDNVIRIVIPDGQVTEQGDVVYSNGDAQGYEVTVTSYEDSSGVKAYKYHDTAGADELS